VNFQSRTLLAVALCAIIYIVWDLFFMPKEPLPPEGETVAAEQEGKQVAEPPDGEGARPVRDVPEAEPAPSGVPAFEVARHHIDNDLLSIFLTNRSPGDGGVISAIHLLADQFAGHDTATDAFGLGTGQTLEVSFADAESDFRVPARVAYEVREVSASHVTLGYASGEVDIEERFELLEGYQARLRVRVTNRTNTEQRHRMHLAVRMGQGEDSRYDVHRGLCRTSEDLEYEDASDVEDGPIRYTGPILWGGVDSKYFGILMVPDEPFGGCEIAAEGEFMVDRLASEVNTLGPGETKDYLIGLYIGAKELDRLGAFTAVDVLDKDLQEAIDWGMLGGLSEVLGRLLLGMLRWFYALTASWGFAIVCLTVVVKVLTLPLTLKQMNSMKRMKEIQPEISKIKEKYGDDRVKQGQEMQALFARSGVNPLAGCLPMIVQLPIWFALYSMLGTAAELVHESFLWLPDLTKQDPYYALPLGLGAMMILQNRMMPMGGDPTQAKMMRWVMPIMFTAFMLFLPSGLGVYIFVNIVLSVIQTAIQVGTKNAPTPAAAS
jgi:YidC/Oxa1 family membrane protein insertase